MGGLPLREEIPVTRGSIEDLYDDMFDPDGIDPVIDDS